MLQGLLPSHLRVEASVLNAGETLGVAIVSGNYLDHMAYEFGLVGRSETSVGRPGPLFDHGAALRIAEDWRSGAYVPVAPVLKQVAPNVPIITTRDGLVEWVLKARKGDQCCYFKGNLATFRNNTPAEIVALQKKHDSRRTKADPLAAARVRETQLRRTMELVEHTKKLFDSGMITFSQRREAGETIYLATRIGGHMTDSGRALQTQTMDIRKELRNAITAAWKRFDRSFKIANIDFEGTQDKIHDITAKVSIFKNDPQRTVDIRIAYRDLGKERQRWPHVLQQKGLAATKQIRMRDGIAKDRKTLDDFAD